MDRGLIPAREMLAGDACTVAAAHVVGESSSPLPTGATMLVEEARMVLDSGARTSAETAGSVLGGIVARRNAPPRSPLAETQGSAHGREAVSGAR